MQFKIERITHPTSEFWKSFDKLAKGSCDFTVHFNSIWYSNYIKYYLKENQSTFIIGVYHNEDLVGCLPLQASKKRATRFYDYTELRILGFGPTDFFDIPSIESHREAILLSIIQFLKKDNTWDKLILTSLPESSKNVSAFIKVLEQQKVSFKLEELNGFVYTKTKGDWNHYLEEKFNPKNKDLAKAERRIDRQGYKLKFTSYKENVYKELLKNIDLYAQRRESLGQFNDYETENLKNFLRNIIETYEEKKMVELTVLEADNETWAFQLDWIANRTRYHWNHAYNEDYKRYSPGKLILKELLRSSFKNPDIDYCNHMRGLSSYKEKFTEERQMLKSIEFENPKSKKMKLTNLISKTLKTIK